MCHESENYNLHYRHTLRFPFPSPFPFSYPFPLLPSPSLPIFLLSLSLSYHLLSFHYQSYPLPPPLPPVEEHFNANVQLRRTSAKDVKIAQQAQKEEVQEFRQKERQRLASLKERYTKTLFYSIVVCKCQIV